VVLEVAGRLSDVVQDLDRAIQLVLADGPRAVVCDLSAVRGGVSPDTVEVLAAAGRHVRHWPGTPVCVACPDTRVRQVLNAHPLGEHLTAAETLSSAIDAVLATPTLAAKRLRIANHPPAQHAVLDFISRTLREWEVSRVIPVANLVVSELVASAVVNTGSDMDLSIAWHVGALRLSVRDVIARPLSQHHSVVDLHQPGLTQVAELSHAFGVLPTADGGKVLWAVLDAPRLQPSTHLRPIST